MTLNENGFVSRLITIEGEDAPSLIGHRGDMLDSLQYLANLCLARKSEGERIQSDLCEKVEHIKSVVEDIERRSGDDIGGYKKRLEEKLRAALADNNITVDENRILTECAIYADRAAIDEEIVRLKSHFCAFYDYTSAGEPVGRSLDFLVQEMNREINTIGSKCQNSGIAHLVVECKTEMEKIREQIQNIE